MIDKKEYLELMTKNPADGGGFYFMITERIESDSAQSYVTVQIRKCTSLDDVEDLYEKINLTHKICRSWTGSFPRFYLNEQPDD